MTDDIMRFIEEAGQEEGREHCLVLEQLKQKDRTSPRFSPEMEIGTN